MQKDSNNMHAFVRLGSYDTSSSNNIHFTHLGRTTHPQSPHESPQPRNIRKVSSFSNSKLKQTINLNMLKMNLCQIIERLDNEYQKFNHDIEHLDIEGRMFNAR